MKQTPLMTREERLAQRAADKKAAADKAAADLKAAMKSPSRAERRRIDKSKRMERTVDEGIDRMATVRKIQKAQKKARKQAAQATKETA